jgi:hypothetical protein
MRNPYKILVRKPEGKRPVARPRCRWEDNIRMVVRERGWEEVGWIHQAQDKDQWWVSVYTIMKIGCHKR